MPRQPKTLGGAVIARHGIRVWWHVQRVLMVWLMSTELLGHEPTWQEAVELSGISEATLMRDLRSLREVWPDVSISQLCQRIRSARPAGSAEDAVLTSPAVGWS